MCALLLQNLPKYRSVIRLEDGARVLLRPLLPEDGAKLIVLFEEASDEDVMYLKDDVRDGELVQSWVANLDYRRVFPLVACVEGRLVGDVSLHFHTGPTRHIGRVRIFLARDYRHRGLGTKMLREVVEIAKRFGLQQLLAEVVVEQTQVVKAFQKLGFELESHYRDYFMTADGITHDMAILRLPLVPRRDIF
ncbi:MAG: GNAT family N-acetyltransferase [Dehalococcoidales bacterium]|nr:GNAT family N-acetyltransferase [Dehalococcoidales bacterium]